MRSSEAMRLIRRLPLLLVPALLAFAVGKAQGQQAATLTLEEAVRLARQNNPAYRMTANDAAVADWNVAESLASLLPSASMGTGFSYTPAGQPQTFGQFTAADLGISETPPYYASSYSINMSLSLSGNTFFQIAQQKANRAATDARISAAGYTLRADVTREYLSALRSKETVGLAKKDLQSAQESQKLAHARFEVGEGTKIDVAQADVAVGRGEVALIQAENQYETDKLRLLERIGVSLDRDVELTSSLEIFEPAWTREDLTAMAMSNHPQLAAARAAEAASKAASRATKTAYLPTLSLSAGWGGFAREIGSRSHVIEDARETVEGQKASCLSNNRIRGLLGDPLQDCEKFVFTPEIQQRALEVNDVFPFSWVGQTPSFRAGISIPIFDGLSRERQMQQARANAEDARHQRRQAELAQQTFVSTAFLNLKAAQRSVSLEKRNAETAAVQLELARERYRLGAGTFVELSTAEALKARADRDYLNAVYTFHENVAALEAAVGQPLRR